MVSPRGRSVCHMPLHLTRLVIQLEARSSSGRNRCLSAGLGASRTYANTLWFLIGRVLKQVKTRGHSGGFSLERSTVISSSSGDAMGFSLVDTFQIRLGISSWPLGRPNQTRLTIPISRHGYAGAVQGVRILFLGL